MKTETRNCQNCKSQFLIEPDDFGFYEKIGVPPPTWCPVCRKQRRLSWRNDMNLYSRKCDLCKRAIVSIYSTDKPFPVYCPKCWWSDKWDPKSYAQDYDFSKTFFEQFKELQGKVPALALVNDDGIASVNCEYTQDFAFSKNCYMVFIAWKLENCMYGNYAVHGKDNLDFLSSMGECQYTYDTVFTEKCYQSRNVYYSSSLSNCAFCYDCRDSLDCFMCVGLRHKRHCFKNKQYTKEEYEKVLKEYRLDTWSGVERAKKEFQPMLLQYPRKFANFRNCVNCTGDALINGKNSKYCFNVQRPEDCKWFENGDTPKDSYDLSIGGELNQCYEGITPDHSYRNFFSIFSWKNTNVAYVDACHSSKNLFGCCGLKSAEYSILNKQYVKEEYEKLVQRIKAHMDLQPYIAKDGTPYRFGEFFPSELSYFGYNETVAQEFIPLTKEKAVEKNLPWQDHFQFTTGKETMAAGALPETIKEVSDSILKEIFVCERCKRNFKITAQELNFYRLLNIAIPRHCFCCRHTERLLIKNPNTLWHRACTCGGAKSTNDVYQNTISHFHGADHCPNEFETTYAPERKEIVYCEQCYNAEVA